jgi:hypothetical protein
MNEELKERGRMASSGHYPRSFWTELKKATKTSVTTADVLSETVIVRLPNTNQKRFRCKSSGGLMKFCSHTSYLINDRHFACGVEDFSKNQNRVIKCRR